MARRAFLLLLLTFGGLVGLDASPAAADTTFTVTTTSDVVNNSDAFLSLREAVDAANADPDASVIDLAPNVTYNLSLCGGGTEENNNVGGDLNSVHLSGDLTIHGAGSTIAQTCDDERVMTQADDDLTLDHVTILGGDLDVLGSSTGGGVFVGPSVTLTLAHSVVRGNTANFGGGIFGTKIVIDDTSITGNEAAVGGAVFLESSGRELTVTDSSIVANTANSTPGVFFSGAGTAVLTNATLGGSTAHVSNGSAGTELNNPGSVTLVHSTLVGGPNGPPLKAGTTLTSFGSVIVSDLANGACVTGAVTTSQGYNVESPNDSCGFDDSTDRVLEPDDGLDPLADSGGAGDTYLPTDGGLLDGLIPPADCSPTVTTDARGQVRPTGTGCEPGAVERPALRQPDGQIRNSNQAAFGGNDVYTTTGAGQTRSQNRRVNQKATFFVRVQNDGDEVDGLRVRGPASGNGFTIRYFVGTTSTNVTNAVTHAGHVFADVAVGGTKLVRVEVTPTSASHRNVTKTVTIRASSLETSTVQDVVKASVKRT